jgi:teichuronic acid biosynthesis protein TuaE
MKSVDSMKWNRTLSLYLFVFLLFIDPFLFSVSLGPIVITPSRLFLAAYILYEMKEYMVHKQWPFSLKNLKVPLAFFGLWFYYGLLSTTWAANKSLAIKELFYFVIFLFVILAIIGLLMKIDHDEAKVQKIFNVIGIITIVIALVEIVFNMHLPTSRYATNIQFMELDLRVATAYFYNENDLSLFLVLISPFYLANIFKGKFHFHLFYIGMTGLLCFIIYQNGSRAALASVLIQIAVWFFIHHQKMAKVMLWIGLVFTPIVSFAIFSKVSTLWGFYNLTAESVNSMQVRLNLVFSGVYSSLRAFLVGVGPGNFEVNVDKDLFNTHGIVNPHNWWVELFTNYGLFITLAFIAFFIYLIRQLYRLYKVNHQRLPLIYLLSLCGFILASIGPSRTFYFWPMWLIYALILAYLNKRMKISQGNESFQ